MWTWSPTCRRQDFFKLKEDGKVKLLEGAEIRTIFFVMDQGSEELRDVQREGQEPVQGQARS